MKNKIKIILSYFEINNEPNKYKIKINTIDFIFKANNQSIFKYKKYINDSFENVAEMKFDTNNKKYTKTINKASKIISLDVLNKQIYKNYKRKYKELYFANIIIQYDYKKNGIIFFIIIIYCIDIILHIIMDLNINSKDIIVGEKKIYFILCLFQINIIYNMILHFL
jgi:hypothetical protein